MKLLPWEYAVRNLGRSPTRLALSLGGSALVVLLVLAAGAFVRGMNRSLTASGGERNVILLGAGSEESVERSEINPATGALAQASIPGVKSTLGVSYISPEVHMPAEVRLTHDSPGLLALLRGITAPAFLVHPQVRMIDGRAPEPGRDELMAGALAATRMSIPDAELAVGRTIHFDGRPWTITGRFIAPNTVMEAELWMPLSDLQIAARRDNLSCVILTLGEADFDDVDLFTKQRLDLELVAMTEGEYYGKLMEFYGPIRAMVWITAGLIALGGLFGGLNTMYAAFSARVRELGSLQAIGFSRRAILLSLIQESTLTTAAGSLLAAAVGLFLLDGLAVRFSMGAFGLIIDSTVLATALAAGLALGIVGALPPAWRALRLPVTDALKAT